MAQRRGRSRSSVATAISEVTWRVQTQKRPRLLGAVCMNPKLTASPLGAPLFYFFFFAAAFFFGFAAFFVAFFID